MRNLLSSLIVLAVAAFQTGIHGQGPASGTAGAPNRAQLALGEGARLEEAGDTPGALEAYRRAVSEAGAVSRDRADALIALANLQTGLGKYADGRAHAREAATIFGTLGETRDRSMALNHAGLASLYEGDYGEAERDFRSAIDLSREMKDPDGLAEQIGNLGNVMFFRGQYADAARLYDDALGVTASAGAAAWVPRRRRILLANQASLFQRLGRDREALALYHQLGASSSDLPPAEHAQLLANLGVLYRRLGDPVKALETYDAARALFARDRHVDGEIGVLNKRGIVLALDLGRLDEAEHMFSGALDAATRAGNRREALHAHLYRAETLLRAGKTARARADYEAALELSRTLKTPEEEWKALYGIGRTTSGAESVEALTRAVTTIEGIREGIRVPSLRSDFLTDKREVYDSLLASRLAADVPAGEMFSLLERSHSRVWRERLGLPAQVDLAAVQRLLPDGVLILDYWHSALGSAVIAITRTRASVIRLDVDAARIGRLIDSLGEGISTTWQEDTAALSRVLPPADWFAAIAHVVIVPDGALALVPFELLKVGDRPLLEHSAVSYTPTAAAMLREPPHVRSVRAPWSMQLRAFGDPVFGSASLDDGTSVRGALSGTAEEITGIASELAGREELNLRERNLKAQLFTNPARAPVLHIASHAMADANAMEQSRILFSSPDGRSAADYLFLNEAYGLPLEGVELAVLSACDTARGRLVRGEGVQSFSRAFLASGARSTVTTLWRVPDEPTREFMKIFYHHVQQGLPRDEALRRAKLRFIESRALAHPHYWAAFVLTGDGVRPVPTALSWTAVLAPSVVLLGLAGAVIGSRYRKSRLR